jgi:hypothetical protein
MTQTAKNDLCYACLNECKRDSFYSVFGCPQRLFKALATSGDNMTNYQNTKKLTISYEEL